MTRTRAAEKPRPLPKAISPEEIANGTARLQEVLTAINDFSQEGFPYRDAARTKAELQLRECVKQVFGERSQEFQTYRDYRLRSSNKTETAQSIAAVKDLIQTLEHKKLELQELNTPSVAASETGKINPTNTARMSLVQPTPPVTITQPSALAPEPLRPAAPKPPMPQASADPIASSPPAHTPVSQPAPPPPKPAASQAIPISTTPSAPVAHEVSTPPAQPSSVSTSAPTVPTSPMPPASADPIASGPPAHTPVSQPAPPPPIPAASQATPTSTTPSAPAAHEISTAPAQPSTVQTAPDGPSFHSLSEQEPLQLIRKVCLRLHSVARQLRLRKDSRPTVEVEDDYDLQDLLRALLKMEFDEVGADEWTPPYAGSAPRTALLLNREQIAVVTKKTRSGLTVKDIAEQVTADSAFYSARNKCTTLFCFIYDPEGRIGSPKRLETDLTRVSDRYTVEVLVAPK